MMSAKHINLIFVDKKNSCIHKNAVLNFLRDDYIKNGNPGNHFWHNRQSIENAFDKNTAMVALNKQKDVVGYMIWWPYDFGAEISIVEVHKSYRQQGICKKMLAALCDKFPSIHILTADVLAQAQKAFNRLGWDIVCNKESPGSKSHFKIVKPCLQPSKSLEDGRVIAVCTKDDFWRVQKNPQLYEGHMQYFSIELDKNNRLRQPVITEFHNNAYIGIYKDKKLLLEGKVGHLFADFIFHHNLLILGRINPLQQDAWYSSDFLHRKSSPEFFPNEQKKAAKRKREEEEQPNKRRKISNSSVKT